VTARRRGVVSLCVMGRFLLSALIGGVALIGLAVASGQTAGIAASGGPFHLNGDLSIAGTNGFDGDRSLKGGRGMRLSCVAGRHYAFAVTVSNSSGKAVMLTGARGPNPAPTVVDPVATQLRLAPPPSNGDRLVIVLRHWSSSPGHPVTVKPGRSAVVQSNFLMRQCQSLAHGRTIPVPGTLTLRYSASGITHSQRVVQPGAEFVVAEGPTIRSCSPVAGSIRMAASDISCAKARAAAPACHHLSHGNYGTCSGAGRQWDCDFRAVTVEWCWYRGGENAHLFRVRWEPKKH